MRLLDKVGIITGGSSGLGKATAIKFASEGAKVVVTDLDEAGGRKTVEQIQAAGGEAAFIQTDVSSFDQVQRSVHFAVEQFGSLDVMFNNAGMNIAKPLLDFEPEEFDKVLQVNQYGVYYGILAAGEEIAKLGRKGVIINTASVFSYVATKGVIAYQASKAAVKLMTQAAALELADNGIRVVAIAPGGIDTPFIQFRKDLGQEEKMAKMHMRGKLLQAEQIANIVAFLASEESDVINGSTVMVDDGLAAFRG
ncbi:SDR family NAD(P)-dependent oxidoreductase [Neobacillus citreus]|uniref:SDR family oxidoreductase n=1 Tax=Neobacillus citreus TaxID=2833578 RepID=A0A942T2Y5_9BACI|nr:SDR family oxidoreductase [Neobacillus citreus]MCH6267968.1 SDR family oxidoreductase [Neobacillus citreus]